MASERAGSVPTLTGRVGTVALVVLAGVSAATCRVLGTDPAVSQRTFELTYVATVDAIPGRCSHTPDVDAVSSE